MSDTFITIMIILIAAVLVFMVPVVTVAKRNDVTATQEVQATVTEFVDKVRVTGMIKEEDYDNLLQDLEASGNVYDVQVHVQQIDENPAKKSSTDISDRIKIGENIYYIEYTTQIEDAFRKNTDGVIRLSEGDYVKVDVSNTNQTLYQTFKRTLYNLSNGRIGTISGVHVGIIINPTEGQQLVANTGAEESCTIYYNQNTTETVTNMPNSQTKYKGIDLTLSPLKPKHSNTDWEFLGWSENPNAIEPDYVAGGVFTKDSKSDIILYAIYGKVTYNVMYLANLDIAVEGLPTQDDGITKGTEYPIWNGRTDPTARGYEFLGWSMTTDGSIIEQQSVTINENLVLYAQWAPKEFRVYYNINTTDSTLNRQDLPEYVDGNKYNTPFTIPNKEPTRNNYKFLGWSTTKNGDVQYKPGEECLLTPYDEEKTLYAVWGEKHTLSYDSNIKVLVAGYRNANWVNSAVNDLNNSEQFTADGVVIEEGNLEAVADKKDEYDLIIVNASAWSLATVDSSNGKALIKEIANSTNVITFGNDESNIPLIESKTGMSNVNMDITATEEGKQLVGENITRQSDSALSAVKFNSDVTVLYTATYTSYDGEVKGEYDAIGITQWKKGNNWVHGQISRVTNQLLYKLAMIAINGPEKTENLVSNMPNPDEEICGNTEIFNLSSSIPTRSNSVFMGWSEAPNGEVQYQAGQEYTMPDEDVTLYAIWGSKLKYSANIKVLVVEYNKDNPKWRDSLVNYLNETEQFIADGMSIGANQLEDVVDKKDDYDVIIINASAWSVSGIGGTSGLKTIAKSTHLITFGNDEKSIPLIKESANQVNVDMMLDPSDIGKTLIGENIAKQSDTTLTSVIFNDDVRVLYIAKYVSKTNEIEELDRAHAIGFCEYTDNTNWIHGQIHTISNSLSYKLIKIALNGLEKTEGVVKNLPQDEVHAQNSTVSISNSIPTRVGYTFKGWAETSDGKVKYKAGDSILMPRGNQTLYAVWKEK